MLFKLPFLCPSLVRSLLLVTVLPYQNSISGFGPEDVNFGRFYKAVTQTSKRLLKEIFLIFIFRARVCTLETYPTNIRDYCYNVLCWSKSKFRTSFNVSERELLNKPIASTDYDVSLLTKLIHQLFQDMNLPESFARAMRELKNARNRVCHEELILDDTELRENMDDLKTLYENLLRETAEFFSVDVDEIKKVYNDEVTLIMDAPLTGDASLCITSVEEFRQELVGKFITLGRKELMATYAKLKTLNPFSWLSDEKFPELTVDKIFAPLHIMNANRHVDIETLLITESISEETQSSTGVLPSVLILSGVAGCGKTSLCRYLLHDWRNNLGYTADMKSVDIIILIEARNLMKSRSKTLIEYLQRIILRETCSEFEEKVIMQTLQKIKVLYIVDGLDEATEKEIQLVEDVLSVLGTSRLIITTRPEFTATAELMAMRNYQSFLSLRIYGFSELGMKAFIFKTFTSLEPKEDVRQQREEEFLRYVSSTGSTLGDLLKIPLALALLILLWKDDKSRVSKVRSATRLYFEIFRMCSTKMIVRLQKNLVTHFIDLESFIQVWLLALGREAYEMLDNDEFILSNDRRSILIALCNDYKVNSMEVLSAFLMCEVQETLTGFQYIFSFIHKSQMEYLAGMFIAHSLTFKSKESQRSINALLQKFQNCKLYEKSAKVLLKVTQLPSLNLYRIDKWRNTMLFVVGHLCMNKNIKEEVIDDVVQSLLAVPTSSSNTTMMWQIVQESEFYPTVCETVGIAAKKDIWHPDVEALCDPTESTLQLLLHTPFVPEKLIIRVPNIDLRVKVPGENGIVENRELVNICPLFECISNKPSAKIELRFDQHYYSWGNPQTTDDILCQVLPFENLTVFMGHLGITGAEALANVKQLEELNIRLSTPEAVHALNSSFIKAKEKFSEEMTLRLDIKPSVTPQSLPHLKDSPKLHLVLKDVNDDNNLWAADVISQLSFSYVEIDFVSSMLSSAGGELLLKYMLERQIEVSRKLTIRSSCGLTEEEYQQLLTTTGYSLAWWS